MPEKRPDPSEVADSIQHLNGTHVGLRHLNTVDANTTPTGLKSSAGMNKTINY